jgi:hypothetical protein
MIPSAMAPRMQQDVSKALWLVSLPVIMPAIMVSSARVPVV